MGKLEKLARQQQPGMPDAWYQSLEQEATGQIDELAAKIAGDDPPKETFRAKLSRLQQARAAAEEMVMEDLILAHPKPLEPADPKRTPQEAKLTAALTEFEEARKSLDEPPPA
jgi:hypothetical protein